MNMSQSTDLLHACKMRGGIIELSSVWFAQTPDSRTRDCLTLDSQTPKFAYVLARQLANEPQDLMMIAKQAEGYKGTPFALTEYTLSTYSRS